MAKDKSKNKTGSAVGSSQHPAEAAFISVLQAIAEAARDMQSADDIASLCQQWVAHLQRGEQPPQGIESVTPAWDQARDFAIKLLRNEHDYAVTRIGDFRQMIWVVIQGLREAFRDEQSSDQEVALHLDRLRNAVETDSIDELRNEVVAAVVIIARVLEERKRRQRMQLEELGAQLTRMRSELMRAQREMALDPMTRLYNRSSFDELLNKTIQLSLFSGQAACLLLIDVDHFKQINDRLGHTSGDRAILAVAEILQKAFPRKGDFACRYGGDEFAVILQDTHLNDGEMLAKRVLAAVKAVTLASEKETMPLSISIGVAELEKGDEPSGWINRADRALYQAKMAGRGCVAKAER